QVVTGPRIDSSAPALPRIRLGVVAHYGLSYERVCVELTVGGNRGYGTLCVDRHADADPGGHHVADAPGPAHAAWHEQHLSGRPAGVCQGCPAPGEPPDSHTPQGSFG